MDNQPVQSPVPEPVLAPDQIPQEKPKFPVMYLVLSVFILLFLVSTAFLYYQNMQLKNIIANYQTPTISPTPSATADPTANWKIYKNEKYGFEIKIPSSLTTTETPATRIGDKISIYLSNNPEECKGDCNIIDNAQTKVINGITTRYLTGWWGEIGGNIAQSYVSYVIPSKSDYLIIQIQELPFSAKYIDIRKIEPVDSQELIQFNQILSTFKFTQ